MNEPMNLGELANRIRDDLGQSGADLTKHTFWPCIEERGKFRILGRPFNDFGELRRVVASNSTRPVYVLEPRNPSNLVKIVNPSELL